MLTRSMWIEAKAAAKRWLVSDEPPVLLVAPTVANLSQYTSQAFGKVQSAIVHADKAVTDPYQWQRDEHRGYAVSSLKTAIVVRLLVRRARRGGRIERIAA